MRSRRHLVGILLSVYTALLLLGLLAPTAGTQSSMIVWLSGLMSGFGIPRSLVQQGRLEVIMNVTAIAPVTLLGSMLRPSLSWRGWTAYGFLASLSVELVQAILLPGRNGAFDDVVANTLGALLGAALFIGFGRSLRLSMS